MKHRELYAEESVESSICRRLILREWNMPHCLYGSVNAASMSAQIIKCRGGM